MRASWLLPPSPPKKDPDLHPALDAAIAVLALAIVGAALLPPCLLAYHLSAGAGWSLPARLLVVCGAGLVAAAVFSALLRWLTRRFPALAGDDGDQAAPETRSTTSPPTQT